MLGCFVGVGYAWFVSMRISFSVGDRWFGRVVVSPVVVLIVVMCGGLMGRVLTCSGLCVWKVSGEVSYSCVR